MRSPAVCFLVLLLAICATASTNSTADEPGGKAPRSCSYKGRYSYYKDYV
jgi:hypothetical protein